MRVLSLAQARRIALAAQGFTGAPAALDTPGSVTARQLRAVVDRLGAVQIDSVNVLVRSHYLPFFSRLGAYDRRLLDRLRDTPPRQVVEYWGHEAALIAPGNWPLFRFRMAAAHEQAWGGMRRVVREHPGLVDAVLEQVRAHGPATSREVEKALAHDLPRDRVDWGWNWSLVKRSLEWLFWSGRLASAGRTTQFERRYAAPEGVAPPALRAAWAAPAVPEHEAVTELVRIAARAHGVASLGCLTDYFRLTRAQAAPAVARLVASGELLPVRVHGWERPPGGAAYLHRDARVPRALTVAALVSPFDSLVWYRERTEGLFGVRYRIEIYTPAAQRVYGYYVLPFFFGDTIVARVDLKADRAAGVLRVPRLTWEPGHPQRAGGAAEALAVHLRRMAAWLGLAHVDAPDLGVTLRG